MSKILICGQRSFAADGLCQELEKAGHIVETFSRGGQRRVKNEISGDVYTMSQNPFFAGDYDIVINFILIKGGSIEDNFRYIESLVSFCRVKGVKRLLHISSISVYKNDAHYVDEDTEIESDYRKKGRYASLKVSIDHKLQNLLSNEKCQLSFVRPGFIIDDDQQVSLGGIVVKTPMGYVLLGDKKTSMPVIRRKIFHKALCSICSSFPEIKSVYLLLENNNGTKYNFTKERGLRTWLLPRKIIMGGAKLAKGFGILSAVRYSQIIGLFKDTYFDSSESEYAVGFSFKDGSVCVMGAGAYGSYTVQTLCEYNPNIPITLLDVGDVNIKDEKEIGYETNLLGKNYNGLAKGRFFGLGGASAKWGGQLLTFTENDFANPTPFLADIVRIDEKYKQRMFKKFKINNQFKENHVNDDMFDKIGVWLGYFSRNLFYYFGIAKKTNVNVVTNARVTKIVCDENNHVKWVEYLKDGKLKHAVYGQYFLTTGAFECNRIILHSGLAKKDEIGFSDHLDQQIFKIHSNGYLGDIDFCYRRDGSSLITKRLIGEIDGLSFYSMPNFNVDFPFFQNVKKIMFEHDFSWSVIGAIVKDLPSVIGFFWCLLFQKRVFVYRNIWYLIIDIENPKENSHIKLSKELDKYGQPGLDVTFKIGLKATEIYEKAKIIIKKYLDEKKVNYEMLDDKIHIDKCADAYHPFGMFLSDSESLDDYFNCFDNLLVLNTGILPRSGGINSTAAIFPLIEEYVFRKMCNKS